MQPNDIATTHADHARKESPFLTTSQAGIYVGLSRRTLEKMRTTGKGPIYRKHGRYVRYHIADLDAWSTAHQKNSTSEADASRQPERRECSAIDDSQRIADTPTGKVRPLA